MSKELIKIEEASELQVIEKSKAEQIQNTFIPMVKILKGFEGNYNAIVKESDSGINEDLTIRAKRLRIDIGKVRIATEQIRKDQKEEYLRAGKAIDGVSNILKWAVIDKENKLKEIEDYYIIQEQKRLKEIQIKRIGLICKYIDDAEERDLSAMDDDVWGAYLSVKKQAFNDRIKAEKETEEKRIVQEKSEAKERERIREENKQLKKKAEAKLIQDEKDRKKRNRLAKIEQDKRDRNEADRLVKEKAERKKRELEEKVRKENELKKQKEYEAKLEIERKKQEKIKKDAERKTADKAIINRFILICQSSINPDLYSYLIDKIIPVLMKNRKL